MREVPECEDFEIVPRAMAARMENSARSDVKKSELEVQQAQT